MCEDERAVFSIPLETGSWLSDLTLTYSNSTKLRSKPRTSVGRRLYIFFENFEPVLLNKKDKLAEQPLCLFQMTEVSIF